MNLRNKLDSVLMEYIKEFEKKHLMEMEGSVSDDLMGIICFGDILFFNMDDIVFDIDNKLPKEMIVDWLDDCMAHQDKYINLRSYSMGLRFKDLK